MTFYLPAIVAGSVETTLDKPAFRILGAFSRARVAVGTCAPRVGKWIDPHAGRGAFLTCIAVIAIGQAGNAVAPDWAVWYVGWTIVGIGMLMGLHDAAFATVGGLPAKDAGPSITEITSMAGFASTVFWTLGAALIGILERRGLLFACAGQMLLVNLPMVWLLLPPASPRLEQRSAGDTGPISRAGKHAAVLLGIFFALRWFIN